MEIKLLYGNESIIFDVPSKQLRFNIKPSHTAKMNNLSKGILNSLKKPISSLPLSSLLNRKKSVCLIVDDNTRPTPTDKIIPPLIEFINDCGVKDDFIKIIVALGTHREMTAQELRLKFGEEVKERIDIVNHQYKQEKHLKYIGKTQHGTPIWINKDVFNFDVKIGIGNIVPHVYAGWSGGGKIIQPGISGEETTGYTHLLGARQPLGSIQGKVDNKIRNEIENVAKTVSLNMIINTTLNQSNDVVNLFTGDIVQAHRKGVESAKKIYSVNIPERADIVVTSPYPADIDYWQASKGVVTGQLAVKKGGTIIFLSPCHEGISPIHESAILDLGEDSFKDIDIKVKRNEIKDLVGAAAAMVHAKVKEWADIIVISDGLTEKTIESIGLKKMDAIEDAIDFAFRKSGKEASIGIMSHSGDLMPIINPL